VGTFYLTLRNALGEEERLPAAGEAEMVFARK
jgi:hypothetical protein